MINIIKCKNCLIEFNTIKKKQKYCSRKCMGIGQTNNSFYNTATKEQKIEKIRYKFEKFVIKNGNQCWKWKGSWGGGYPQININKRIIRGHRASYLLNISDIPSGMFVLHKCDNKECCNPEHLFLGTQKDNMRDKINKGRSNIVRGEKCSFAKLKTNDVLKIKLMIKNGILLSNISKIYNVSDTLIRKIKNNKVWKHILLGV